MECLLQLLGALCCECRAFGRLQEDGHEDLAVDCFGYVLLDEEHERVLLDRFPNITLNGNIELPDADDLRGRFRGRDARPPPIRCIVKESRERVGTTEDDEVQPAAVTKLLGDIKRLQQLGIIRLDTGARQLVGGKIVDFSQAITVAPFCYNA